MPDSNNEKRFFTLPRFLGVLSFLAILAGIALIVVSALSLLALPIFWPILILAGGLSGIFASVVLSKSSDKPSRAEELPEQRSTELETVVNRDTVNTLGPQIAQTQIFVRYQEAFPTVAEVKAAVAKGAKGKEIPYGSDHLPILFQTDEATIFSYNLLMGDKANGFADASENIFNGTVGETAGQTVERNKKNIQLMEKVRNKYNPDILCLQECTVPTEDKNDNSKLKFNVSTGEKRIFLNREKTMSAYVSTEPVLVDLPKNYQFKGQTLSGKSYNSASNDFNYTITLFSDNFLSRYDVELDVDGCTWKCTNKADKNKILKVFNGHIQHKDNFALTESKIKRQLVNSLSDDASAEEVTSFNVGDFNNRVAPVNDNKPQNLTECARAACCTEDKIQGCASGSGAYKATGTKKNSKFKQVKGTFIDPKTGELMENIPPLDTTLMPASQAKEVKKIEPVMCIDDYYQDTKVIGNKTIFEYEIFLRQQLSMKAPIEPDISAEALIERIEAIELLEDTNLPKKEGVIFFKKCPSRKVEGGDRSTTAIWNKGEKEIKSLSESKDKNVLKQKLNDLSSRKIKRIEKTTHSKDFFDILSLCNYVFTEQLECVYSYDRDLTQLLFIRLGATINNDRSLVVALPKDHAKSKAFYDVLHQELGNEKTILFQEKNSWFQSKKPYLINYQISIPLDKIDLFHAAVMKHFNLALENTQEASSSTSSIYPKNN